MTREAFVAKYGGVFENSPWIAERAFASTDNPYDAMIAVMYAASRDEQLALIRAHPDLGTRAKISQSSTAEQTGAGLDRLTPEEYERLSRLNAQYKEKFGFPFIFAVKGADKTAILAELERRVNSTPEEEFMEALRQIARIARFRVPVAQAFLPVSGSTGIPACVPTGKESTMHHFASGPKRNYYGKAGVTVYRLRRDTDGAVFAADVRLLTYGDAFWPTYTTGDNTGLVATDSMKNFIQRETLNFTGEDLESYCRFLAEKFLQTYPQAEGVQISATEIPYDALIPGGPERATATVELTHAGLVGSRSGIVGFRLLRATGSSFTGFVRDEYTTLPEIRNRPLHMWLDLDWVGAAESKAVRGIVFKVFNSFKSGSIQQMVHKIGNEILEQIPAIVEVNLVAQNRTWDTVVEQGDAIGIYTDSRPPYGLIGLSLRR